MSVLYLPFSGNISLYCDIKINHGLGNVSIFIIKKSIIRILLNDFTSCLRSLPISIISLYYNSFDSSKIYFLLLGGLYSLFNYFYFCFPHDTMFKSPGVNRNLLLLFCFGAISPSIKPWIFVLLWFPGPLSHIFRDIDIIILYLEKFI